VPAVTDTNACFRGEVQSVLGDGMGVAHRPSLTLNPRSCLCLGGTHDAHIIAIQVRFSRYRVEYCSANADWPLRLVSDWTIAKVVAYFQTF
jgi:hypothetical protein